MKIRNLFQRIRNEDGAGLVELAFVLPLFPLLLFGALDFGRAFYLSVEVAGAAHAAALYGSQNPTDTAGIRQAALLDAPDVPNLSAGTPVYGSECSDGTKYTTGAATLACPSNNQVSRVDVTVTGTYSPLIPWPGVPSSLPLSSTASMRGN